MKNYLSRCSDRNRTKIHPLRAPNRKVTIKPDEQRRPPFCITADQQTRRRFCKSLYAQVTHTEFKTPARRQLWFIRELSEQFMRSLQFTCSLFSWTWLMCERAQFNIPAVGMFCIPDVTFLCKRMFLAASLGLPLAAWRGLNKITMHVSFRLDVDRTQWLCARI